MTVAPGRIVFGATTPLSVRRRPLIRTRPPIGSIVLPAFLTARKRAPWRVVPCSKRRFGRARYNQFSPSPAYRLPQTCTDNQTAKWDDANNIWTCATDNSGTAYTAGAGLDLTGSQFSISSTYRLPQSCGTNQTAKWDNTVKTWSCADDTDTTTTYTAGNGIAITGTTVSANFAGTGSATTIARSDHDHDSRYYTETELSTDTSAQVHWNNLTNIPARL